MPENAVRPLNGPATPDPDPPRWVPTRASLHLYRRPVPSASGRNQVPLNRGTLSVLVSDPLRVMKVKLAGKVRHRALVLVMVLVLIVVLTVALTVVGRLMTTLVGLLMMTMSTYGGHRSAACRHERLD